MGDPSARHLVKAIIDGLCGADLTVDQFICMNPEDARLVAHLLSGSRAPWADAIADKILESAATEESVIMVVPSAVIEEVSAALTLGIERHDTRCQFGNATIH